MLKKIKNKGDINVGNMGKFVLDSYRKVMTKRRDEEPKDLLNIFFSFFLFIKNNSSQD